MGKETIPFQEMGQSPFTAMLVVSAAALLAGCGESAGDPRVLGRAYVGPVTLTLHAEISPKSPAVATVPHGDRLDILGRRRRFVKVRTASGIVGWTDMYQLLAASQMEKLDKLAGQAKELPSHGQATVYDGLNVHTEPNRQAPSFYRIREGEKVDVVLHRPAPRSQFNRAPLLASAPKPVAKKKSRKEPKYPPPPLPAAPEPPDDWLELSKTNLPPELQPPPPPPVPVDDWSLVRLPTGRAGWVLTSMLRMSIPDEVAQYSEGQRITSYFAMREVKDGGEIRHDWLWTTLSTPKQPWQFDSFRYFIWNTRRHRFETSYIERNIKGYFPVEVRPVQMTAGDKTETFPGFSLIVEEADGTRWRKSYAYQYYRVVLAGKQPYEPQEEELAPAAPHAPAPAKKGEGWLAQIRHLKQKLLGR